MLWAAPTKKRNKYPKGTITKRYRGIIEIQDGSRKDYDEPGTPQHLYIMDVTFMITEGDWWLGGDTGLRRCVGERPTNPACKQVVATTDPQLIADGVASISENFLLEYVRRQGKGSILIEVEQKTYFTGVEDANGVKEINFEQPTIKCDASGNAILSFSPEVIDPITEAVNNYLSTCIDEPYIHEKRNSFAHGWEACKNYYNIK